MDLIIALGLPLVTLTLLYFLIASNTIQMPDFNKSSTAWNVGIVLIVVVSAVIYATKQ